MLSPDLWISNTSRYFSFAYSHDLSYERERYIIIRLKWVKTIEKVIISRNIQGNTPRVLLFCLVPWIKEILTVSVYVICPEKCMIYWNNGQSSQWNRNGLYDYQNNRQYGPNQRPSDHESSTHVSCATAGLERGGGLHALRPLLGYFT